MKYFTALLAGVLFGLGALLSGMANPDKVQGFLDLFGQWDPSLALVMAAAIGVAIGPFTWAKRRQKALISECPMQLPTNTSIDQRIVIGSLLFGAGWGLGGICPGPALAAVMIGGSQVMLFVVAMLAGMYLAKRLFAL